MKLNPNRKKEKLWNLYCIYVGSRIVTDLFSKSCLPYIGVRPEILIIIILIVRSFNTISILALAVSVPSQLFIYMRMVLFNYSDYENLYEFVY